MKIIAMIGLTWLTCHAVDFKDTTFKLNASYNPSNWEQTENETFRDRLTLRHLSLPATINVLAYRFNETITANGLVQKRIQSVYDGWQLIRQEPISTVDAKKKNVTKGIRSIYKKTYLDNELKEQTLIAGDICFVTDDTLGLILNVSVTHSDTLLDIKSDFNEFYANFWYGDNKPEVYSVTNDSSEWVMANQNLSRKRVFSSTFSLNNDTIIEKIVPINASIQANDIQTYHNHNGDYMLLNSDLHIISPITNTTKTIKLNMLNPELILTKDGFYAIQKTPTLLVKKYDDSANEISTTSEPIAATNVVAINDHLLIVSSNQIQLRKHTEPVWTVAHNRPVEAVAVNGEQLIIAHPNASITLLDLNTGQSITTLDTHVTADQRFKDMALNESKLLVIANNGAEVTQSIINLADGTVEDTRAQEYRDFTLVSVSKALIIFQYVHPDGHRALSALDFNTFAPVWEKPYDHHNHTLVSDNSFLSADTENNLTMFTLSSAKKSNRINLTKLMHPDAPTENGVELQVLGLAPSKTSLFAVVNDNKDNKIVILR